MKRLSFWLILSGLSLCLLAGCGQKTQGRLPKLPEDEHVELSICFENQYSERNLYSKEEVQALNDLLAQASAQPVEDWTVPEDPWPIYGICIWNAIGDGQDLDVACFGNLWVDNQGRAFQVEGLDLQALTDIFPEGWDQEDRSYIPSRRALALRDGHWNEQFLIPSDLPPLWTDVSMTLDDPSEGLSWTLTNLGQRQFFHGNGGHANLQVCLEDAWYYVPVQFGYFVTDEGITLPPGGSYSYTSSLNAYGDLPPGRYRIVFSSYLEKAPLTEEDYSEESLPEEGYSAVRFLIQEGGTFARDNLC